MRNIIRTSHEARRRQSGAGIEGTASLGCRDSMPILSHQMLFTNLKESLQHVAPRTPPPNRMYQQHTEFHHSSSLDHSTRQRISASSRSAAVSPLNFSVARSAISESDLHKEPTSVTSLSMSSKRHRRAAFARRISRQRISSDSVDGEADVSISYARVVVVLLFVFGCLLSVLLLSYLLKRKHT